MTQHERLDTCLTCLGKRVVFGELVEVGIKYTVEVHVGVVITQHYRVARFAYFFHFFFEHVEDALVEVRVSFFYFKERLVFEVVHVDRALGVKVIRGAVTVVDVATDERKRVSCRQR